MLYEPSGAISRKTMLFKSTPLRTVEPDDKADSTDPQSPDRLVWRSFAEWVAWMIVAVNGIARGTELRGEWFSGVHEPVDRYGGYLMLESIRR